jgi:hypothetical protein
MKHTTPNKQLAVGLLAALATTALLSAGPAHAQEEADPCSSDGLNESDECEGGGGSVVLDEVVVVGDPFPDPPGPRPPSPPVAPPQPGTSPPDWSDAGGGAARVSRCSEHKALSSKLDEVNNNIAAITKAMPGLERDEALHREQELFDAEELTFYRQQWEERKRLSNSYLSNFDFDVQQYIQSGNPSVTIEYTERGKPIRIVQRVTAAMKRDRQTYLDQYQRPELDAWSRHHAADSRHTAAQKAAAEKSTLVDDARGALSLNKVMKADIEATMAALEAAGLPSGCRRP